jgi:hypothetical protein
MYLQIFNKFILQRILLIKSNICTINNGTKVKAQATKDHFQTQFLFNYIRRN